QSPVESNVRDEAIPANPGDASCRQGGSATAASRGRRASRGGVRSARGRLEKGACIEWHSVKLNTLGFKVLRRKTPAHRLIIDNMISISLDPKPRVSEAYSICYIRTFGD